MPSIQIRKGPSASTLHPFFVISTPPDVDNLSKLREQLQKHGYMNAVDVFLNKSLYRIHQADEESTSLDSVTCDEKESGDRALSILEVPLPPSPLKPVIAADGALRILKGISVDDLKPFRAITVKESVLTLADLRNSLGSSMTRSDRFVTSDGFPVPSGEETTISWANIIQPPPHDHKDNGSEQPLRPKGGEGSATIGILSTGAKPLVPPPSFNDKHQFSNIPNGKDIAIPIQVQPPAAERFRPDEGAPQPNAKMLSEDQVRAIFEYNSLFSGLWLNHPSHPRAFSTLFSPLQKASFLDMIQLADASIIESKTTFSQKDNTLLKQGFDSVTAEMSTPWVSASAAASGSNGLSESHSKSRHYVTSIYRYPRAIVQIDPTKLTPSPEFSADRDEAFGHSDDNLRKEALTKLFKTYGHVFATHVELGGLLQSTQLSTTDKDDVQTTAERSVRAALSAQIQTFSGSGSVETSNKSETGKTQVAAADALAVEAVGGDTTLASNPVLWPGSVIPYVNWRAIKFSDVLLLTEIRTLFTADQKNQVDKLFSQPAVIKERKLIGFYSGTIEPSDWIPASPWIVGGRLYVKAHPTDPNPAELFAPVDGYDLVIATPWGPDFFEPFAAGGHHAALTLVRVPHGEFPPVTPAVTCIKKEFLVFTNDIPREMLVSYADPEYSNVLVENLVTINLDTTKSRLRYGHWEINPNKVEVVTKEKALNP